MEAVGRPSTTPVLIEPATPSDLPDLVRLETACFSAPWTRKMLEAELTGNPFAHFWVARQGGRNGASAIIGYLCFWIVFEELRIMNVAVAEPMRRQGIARRLVTQALSVAREQGAGRAMLEVRVSNKTALAMYERLGFSRTSVRHRYYVSPEEDAVVMEMEPILSR
jgi:ribosomal-protein-alanine N-acetyltransferase